MLWLWRDCKKARISIKVRKRASRNMEILKLGGCEKHCKKRYTIEKVIKEMGLELKSKSVMPYFFQRIRSDQKRQQRRA